MRAKEKEEVGHEDTKAQSKEEVRHKDTKFSLWAS